MRTVAIAYHPKLCILAKSCRCRYSDSNRNTRGGPRSAVSAYRRRNWRAGGEPTGAVTDFQDQILYRLISPGPDGNSPAFDLNFLPRGSVKHGMIVIPVLKTGRPINPSLRKNHSLAQHISRCHTTFLAERYKLVRSWESMNLIVAIRDHQDPAHTILCQEQERLITHT